MLGRNAALRAVEQGLFMRRNVRIVDHCLRERMRRYRDRPRQLRGLR
jgi:hypothetical protein